MFLVSTHLLQDSIDKDRMHYDREAYKFADICIREDIWTNWIHGHVSSHSFSFHYFGNPVCCGIVQNQFQAQSTPSTTFHQEGEDDGNMTYMHMTKLGEWHRDQRDQHGFPNRDKSPKLIRFESPSWTAKSSSSPYQSPGAARTKSDTQARSLSGSSGQAGWPNQVRVHIGVQEQHAPKMTPKQHTESNLDVLYMH